MNVQILSPRFKSVQCFLREIFEEMYRDTMFVSPEGHKYGGQKLTKTCVSEFAIKTLESSSKSS